ncbi:hypothetical protein D3C80_2169210 [compost metagenome]
MYCHGHFLEQLLGNVHHPEIVFVCGIPLQYGKFRVVCAVHTLITEVTAELIHPVKTAYDQSFQV